MKYFRQYFWDLVALLVIGFAIYLSSKAMFHEGFFRTIDDVTTVRIDHMGRELRRGFWLENFPVRLGGELGYRYGYFFYLFYASLVYYVGAILMIVGHLSDIMATKAVYAFPLIVGPLLFYFASRQKLCVFASIIGTIFFTLFPFRAFDIYLRGGVGESWAIAFLPGLFAGIFMIENKNRFGAVLTSLFLSLIIFSHNIAAMLIVPLVVLYGLIFILHKKNFWFSSILALGLTAFFWLPMAFYLPLIGANSSQLNTTFILSTLLPIWEIIKPSLTYIYGQYFVSAFFYIASFGSIFFVLYKGKSKNQGIFWFGISLFLCLILSNISILFWQVTLPISRVFQFSWRVLILLSFTLPLALGFLISALKSKIMKICVAAIIVVLSLSFYPSFQPKEYSYFYSYSADDSSHCGTTTFEEYFPKWVVQCVNQSQLRPYYLTMPGNLVIDKDAIISINAHYTSDTPNQIMAHKYYFPGWHVQVDGKDVVINQEYAISGIIVADIPAGSHTLKIYFSKTIVMWVADTITTISLIIYIYAIIKSFRKNVNIEV